MMRSQYDVNLLPGVELVNERLSVDLSESVGERSGASEAFEASRQEAIDSLRDTEIEGFVLATTCDWMHQSVVHGDRVPDFFGQGDLATAVVIQWIDRLLRDGHDRDEARKMFERELVARVEEYLES